MAKKYTNEEFVGLRATYPNLLLDSPGPNAPADYKKFYKNHLKETKKLFESTLIEQPWLDPQHPDHTKSLNMREYEQITRDHNQHYETLLGAKVAEMSDSPELFIQLSQAVVKGAHHPDSSQSYKSEGVFFDRMSPQHVDKLRAFYDDQLKTAAVMTKGHEYIKQLVTLEHQIKEKEDKIADPTIKDDVKAGYHAALNMLKTDAAKLYNILERASTPDMPLVTNFLPQYRESYKPAKAAPAPFPLPDMAKTVELSKREKLAQKMTRVAGMFSRSSSTSTSTTAAQTHEQEPPKPSGPGGGKS